MKKSSRSTSRLVRLYHRCDTCGLNPCRCTDCGGGTTSVEWEPTSSEYLAFFPADHPPSYATYKEARFA